MGGAKPLPGRWADPWPHASGVRHRREQVVARVVDARFPARVHRDRRVGLLDDRGARDDVAGRERRAAVDRDVLEAAAEIRAARRDRGAGRRGAAVKPLANAGFGVAALDTSRTPVISGSSREARVAVLLGVAAVEGLDGAIAQRGVDRAVADRRSRATSSGPGSAG